MISEGYKHHEAVADAMMVTQHYFLNKSNYDLEKKAIAKSNDPIGEIESLLQWTSRSGCSEGSLNSIMYLQQMYPDYFDYLFLMTLDNRDETYGKSDEILNGFRFHTVFMAKSIEDVWFAGSPANYQTGDMNYMTDLMTSTNLDDVLGLIDNRTPGPWPEPDVIMNKLESYHQPAILGTQHSSIYHSHLQRTQGTDVFEFTSRIRPVGYKPLTVSLNRTYANYSIR